MASSEFAEVMCNRNQVWEQKLSRGLNIRVSCKELSCRTSLGWIAHFTGDPCATSAEAFVDLVPEVAAAVG